MASWKWNIDFRRWIESVWIFSRF